MVSEEIKTEFELGRLLFKTISDFVDDHPTTRIKTSSVAQAAFFLLCGVLEVGDFPDEAKEAFARRLSPSALREHRAELRLILQTWLADSKRIESAH